MTNIIECSLHFLNSQHSSVRSVFQENLLFGAEKYSAVLACALDALVRFTASSRSVSEGIGSLNMTIQLVTNYPLQRVVSVG